MLPQDWPIGSFQCRHMLCPRQPAGVWSEHADFTQNSICIAAAYTWKVQHKLEQKFSGHLSLHDCQNCGINRVYGDATILSTDCSGETRLVLHAPILS